MNLTWQRSGGSGAVLHALLNDRVFAQIVKCPAGWSLRWTHIPWPEPGWNEMHPTEEAAKQACEDFVRGLEIVPWD